jgi:hypothetical protein
MNRWEPDVQSTRAHLPGADSKIVFDKFRVVKHLHDAVDQVRRAEHRALKRAEDDWLMRLRGHEPGPAAGLPGAAAAGSPGRPGQDWTLKERFRAFWDYRYLGAARRFFMRWFWRATHSRLTPVARVAKLIQRHRPNLLTYLRHRVTNAGLEGVNAVIHNYRPEYEADRQRFREGRVCCLAGSRTPGAVDPQPRANPPVVVGVRECVAGRWRRRVMGAAIG